MKKSELLNLLATAWGDEDAHYYVGDGTDDRDFHNGLSPYCSSFVRKDELQQMIEQEDTDTFDVMPDQPEYIVLNKKRFISIDSIRKQQRYPMTVSTEGMTHVYEQGMPHFDVWFSVDQKSKEITFALGDKKKTFEIVEHTKWAWKPSKKRKCIFTISAEFLARDFSDPMWASFCINIGRDLLGFKI